MHIFCKLAVYKRLVWKTSLLVVSRGSTVKHPVITKSRPISEFGRVTVTNKLGQLS